MTHFGLVFKGHARDESKFIFVHCQLFSIVSWKGFPFSVELPLQLCRKSVVHTCVGPFLYSLFFSIGHLSTLTPKLHCCDFCSFRENLCQMGWVLELGSFLFLPLLGLFCFHLNSGIGFTVSPKTLLGIWLGLHGMLTTRGMINIMATLSSDPWTWSSSLLSWVFFSFSSVSQFPVHRCCASFVGFIPVSILPLLRYWQRCH